CNDNITCAQPNIVERIDYSIGGRCTGGYGSIVGPHKTVFYGNICRCNVRNHLGNEEGVETRCSIPFCIVYHLILKSFQSTNSGSPNYTYSKFIHIDKVYSRIENSFV